jgi:hypothetical protein
MIVPLLKPPEQLGKEGCVEKPVPFESARKYPYWDALACVRMLLRGVSEENVIINRINQFQMAMSINWKKNETIPLKQIKWLLNANLFQYSFRHSNNMQDLLREKISKGIPVLVRAKGKDFGSQYSKFRFKCVVVFGYSGKTWIVHDPLEGPNWRFTEKCFPKTGQLIMPKEWS